METLTEVLLTGFLVKGCKEASVWGSRLNAFILKCYLKSDLLSLDFGFELKHTATCHLKGSIRVFTWSCVFYQC